MKTRFYEITVTATKTIVVEVEDNGDEASKIEAETFAFDECFSGRCDVEVQSTKLLENEHEIEQSKRLADEVFDL